MGRQSDTDSDTAPAWPGDGGLPSGQGGPSRSPMCLVTQSCATLCDPTDCSPPGSSVHGDSPGKDTGVGCHALLQGIFSTQRLNPGLLHCRRDSLPSDPPGKLRGVGQVEGNRQGYLGGIYRAAAKQGEDHEASSQGEDPPGGGAGRGARRGGTESRW